VSAVVDEVLPYPFLAIVGQAELKMALVLALINPQIGGVLLIGPYGVGKTTAVQPRQTSSSDASYRTAAQRPHGGCGRRDQ